MFFRHEPRKKNNSILNVLWTVVSYEEINVFVKGNVQILKVTGIGRLMSSVGCLNRH